LPTSSSVCQGIVHLRLEVREPLPEPFQFVGMYVVLGEILRLVGVGPGVE
jgi:hypothetical protein